MGNARARSMIMFAGHFVQFCDVEEFGEIVKMEHRLVFAVFAKEGHVLAEVHIFEVVSDKATIATLYSLAEIF